MTLIEKLKIGKNAQGAIEVEAPHELRAVARLLEDLDDSEIWEEIVQSLRLADQEYVAAGDSHMLEINGEQIIVKDQVGIRDRVVFTRQEFLPLAEFYRHFLKKIETSV